MERLQQNISTLLRKSSLSFLLLLVTLFACEHSYAAVYYFSNSAGNDDYTSVQAQNPATPWKSLDKLNSFFKFFGAGDSILFKRGEVFYGSIEPTKSGAVFAPIYFGAYGHGSNPQISGLVALKSWKPVRNGIYEAACNADGSTLIINGAQQAIGRYPNKGYLSFESHQNNNSITDNQLTDQTNWTGAEVVIRKNRWIIDRSTITAQSGGTITYAEGTKAMPTNGYGYFIQKDIKTLDQFGEWYYDANRKSMMVYFGSKNPAAYTIKTSAVANLVDIRRFNYLTFDSMTFTGAGNNAFNIIQSKKIVVKNCRIDMTGAEAVFANYSPMINIESSFINHSMSSGIDLDAGCINSSVVGNIIKNTGLVAGLGKSGSGTYEAITSFGDNTRIEKNKIDSTGYNGIYFGGNSSYAKNNYIAYFCLTKDDGAGIYIGDWSKTVGKKVIGNIVLHGIGNGAGSNYPASMQAEGIYIDDNTENVTISDNTVSLCTNNGIKIHNAKDIDIFNNIVYNNGVQLRLEQDHYLATSSYIRNNNIRNNTFFSENDHQSIARFSTHQDDINAFGKLDSNFYWRAKAEAANIKTTCVKNGKDVSQTYNLSNWKSAYGKDQFSTEAASGDVLFEYNASSQVKTITLDKQYVDVHKQVYKNKVSINPYSSVLLVASNQTIAKAPQASKLIPELAANSSSHQNILYALVAKGAGK